MRTNNETIGLYNIIKELKSGKLSREALIKYIPLRVKLKDVLLEFEKIKKEAFEQTKPEGFDSMSAEDQKELEKVWIKNTEPVLIDWLNKPCDINSKIFTIEDVIDLIQSNDDLSGYIIDLITEYFVL